MHILHVHKSYAPAIGGIETHLRLLAEHQIRQGHTVTVCVCNTRLRATVEQTDNLTIIRLASLGKLFSMDLGVEVLWKIRRVPADVIHLHTPFPLGELALLWYGKQRPPVVVTWHSDIVRQRWLMPCYRPFQQKFLSSCDRIIATSQQYVDGSEQLRNHRDRITVVPLGLPTQTYQPTPTVLQRAGALRAAYTKPIVLGVGRLVPYKGWEVFVGAMKQVDGQGVIIGEGRLHSRLRQQIQQSGMSPCVELVGFVPFEELLAWYHACEVFVLPSVARNEAFGLVQIEAMLAGKPVVSTLLQTGVEFVNQHNQTGLIVPPRQHVALAEAINHLLADKELRTQLGQNGAQRAREVFDAERCNQCVLEIYQDLLGV